MTQTITAHFRDGVIVPDEPLSLPQDAVLRVTIEPGVSNESAEVQARRAAIEEILAGPKSTADIPDELLRREHIY